MKKITMIVPDSLVNSLLSLVADQTEYLQVEAHSQEEPKAVKDALPIRKYHPRPIGRQSSTKVVADLLLSGPKNLMSIQKALVREGYASNSCYGILQRMHAKSLVEQVGANYQLSSSNQEKK